MENETGPDGGYADYTDMSINLGLGDSLSLWLFPGSVEEVCQHTIHIYADWNQDCDYDDEDELIVWVRTDQENGADIAIPHHARTGETTIRFMLHNGRIRNACQNTIDGEVEDYTINIFSREFDSSKKELVKKVETDTGIGLIEFAPNPLRGDGLLILKGLDTTNEESYHVRLLSTEGTVVYNQLHSGTSNTLNTADLASGIYFVEVTLGKEVSKSKVIIQN